MTDTAVTSQFDLAILGADDPLGESFLKLLEEREIAIGRIFPVTLGDDENSVTFKGSDWPCEPAQDCDFSRAQMLVVTNAHPSARRIVETVRASHPLMPVLDLSAVTPGPVVAIERVLKVLKAVGGVTRVDAFVGLPVGLAGKAGVDELVNQSRGLFNMDTPEPEVFPLQIAFNVMPLMDAPGQRYCPASLKSALCEANDFGDVGFSAIWVPVFFGATAILHVQMSETLAAAEQRDAYQHDLRQALQRREGIILMEADVPAANPTPATDSAESADIFLGRIQVEAGRASLWLVHDPLRLEAEQIVSFVENWIDKPINSVLT